MSEFEVSVRSSIEEIDARTWDALAGDHVFMSHGWLRVLERTQAPPLAHRYVVVHDERALAAATIFRIERDPARRTDSAAILLGDLARVVPPMRSLVFPALTCGTGFGHGSPMLARRGLGAGAHARALQAMVEALQEHARASGAVLRVRNVPRDCAADVAALRVAGCIRTRELPNSVLDIAWDSYDAYLAALRRSHPGAADSARAEHKHARRAGLRIEPVIDVEPMEDVLHGLADAHYRRRNDRPFPFRRGFFTLLREHLGSRAEIYLATLDGRAVGMVVMMMAGEDAYLPFLGVDPVRGRAAAAYFNLAFNTPIRIAIERRLKHLYIGRLLYRMKVRRGCRLTSEDMFVSGGVGARHAALRPLLSMRSWAMDRRLRRQLARHDTASP